MAQEPPAGQGLLNIEDSRTYSDIGLYLQSTLMHNSITTCMSHYYPRHVSGLDMPIFRRNNCTKTASGILALVSGCILHRLRKKIFRHIHTWWDPLDEWSVRCTDLYLTTNNTHNRQTPMTLGGFEPTIPASEQPQTHALDRAATGILCKMYIVSHMRKSNNIKSWK